MFIHHRSVGLIIKKENLGEADQLFTIYTKDFGKLKILGRAIRKIVSKLRSGADIFNLSEIEFIQGKVYKTLTDTILLEKFGNTTKDLRKLKITYKVSESLDKFISGQEADEKTWNLILETYRILDKERLPNYDYRLIYYYFLWNFLSGLGYQLELYRCVLCQKKATPDKIYFNPKEGGIICRDCNKNSLGKETAPETVKILRIILKRNWKMLSKIKIEPSQFKNLELLSRNYISYVSEMTK